MASHPLEDEDVIVTLTLCHEPSGTVVTVTKTAPADGKPDLSDAVDEAKRDARDELLAAIEQKGG